MSSSLKNEEPEAESYEERLEKTGCAKENDDVLLCFADTRDWRKCQKEMKIFQKCFREHSKEKEEQEKKN